MNGMRVRYQRPMDPMKARARATVAAFGSTVRARRLAAGMSQPELGRGARVTGKFIGLIERGTSNPSLVTMAFVADALGCELAELFELEHASGASLRARDVRRARQALDVLGSILMSGRRDGGSQA